MAAKIEASRRMVDETKRLYSSLLTKPLSDKQLFRPQFTFIQDLVKDLITETRILRDVFTPADFDTKRRLWDRPMKVDFVQRLIDFVAKNEHPVVGCVSSKVVSGLDPNKTLELLQGLSKIAHSKFNATDQRRPRTFTKQFGNGESTTPKTELLKRNQSVGSVASSRSSVHNRESIKVPFSNTKQQSANRKNSSDQDTMRTNRRGGINQNHKYPEAQRQLKPTRAPPINDTGLDSNVSRRQVMNVSDAGLSSLKADKPSTSHRTTTENLTNDEVEKLRTNFELLRKSLNSISEFEFPLRKALGISTDHNEPQTLHS